MNDLGQLFLLFEVGHMGRRELEELVAELDEEDRGRARSPRDLEVWARAVSEVLSVDELMEEANSQTGNARGGASRKRTVSVNMDGYERSKAVLDSMADERVDRDELREAARARLSHFEKRDELRYRPAERTPLERYQAALMHIRDGHDTEV